MKRVAAVAGFAIVLAAGVAAVPHAPLRAVGSTRVMVHCPNGNQAAFVSPQPVNISVGDTLVWRVTGQVVSDSLRISLKDSGQTWPFSGPLPAGDTIATTGTARAKGTYGYNVHLQCRLPGGGSEPVVIDPDIIID